MIVLLFVAAVLAVLVAIEFATICRIGRRARAEQQAAAFATTLLHLHKRQQARAWLETLEAQDATS